MLDGGRVGDTRVVPAEWITRIGTPAPDLLSGQYVYVDPASGTVIVKLSDYGEEQDEQETFDALRAIVADSRPR